MRFIVDLQLLGKHKKMVRVERRREEGREGGREREKKERERHTVNQRTVLRMDERWAKEMIQRVIDQ